MIDETGIERVREQHFVARLVEAPERHQAAARVPVVARGVAGIQPDRALELELGLEPVPVRARLGVRQRRPRLRRTRRRASRRWPRSTSPSSPSTSTGGGRSCRAWSRRRTVRCAPASTARLRSRRARRTLRRAPGFRRSAARGDSAPACRGCARPGFPSAAAAARRTPVRWLCSRSATRSAMLSCTANESTQDTSSDSQHS